MLAASSGRGVVRAGLLRRVRQGFKGDSMLLRLYTWSSAGGARADTKSSAIDSAATDSSSGVASTASASALKPAARAAAAAPGFC